MRLKVFHAPNIGAAMAMVRDELGPDALILANRTVEGRVELTAAQEQPPQAVPATASPAPAAKFPLSERSAPASLPISPTEVARVGTLRWHGVQPELAARLGRGDLTGLIGAEFDFGALPCRRHGPPLLLVGPPGAGKTLTTARLATRLRLSGQASMVLTADGRRAGAVEQLAAFTRLLGLTLIVADTPKQLARALARRTEGEPVLVDMPGLNPFDATDQAFIQNCQTTLDAEIAMVIPAGLEPAEAQELAAGFRRLGARYLVATRLDQSRRLGGVLAAASGLVLTEGGVSSAVADGLVPLTPEFIASRLSQTRETLPATSVSPLALVARAHSEKLRTTP